MNEFTGIAKVYVDTLKTANNQVASGKSPIFWETSMMVAGVVFENKYSMDIVTNEADKAGAWVYRVRLLKPNGYLAEETTIDGVLPNKVSIAFEDIIYTLEIQTQNVAASNVKVANMVQIANFLRNAKLFKVSGAQEIEALFAEAFGVFYSGQNADTYVSLLNENTAFATVVWSDEDILASLKEIKGDDCSEELCDYVLETLRSDGTDETISGTDEGFEIITDAIREALKSFNGQ